MKLIALLSATAVLVASGSLGGAPLRIVAAQDSELPTGGSLAAEALEQPAVEAKDADCLDKGFDAETLDCRVCNMLALTLSLQHEKNNEEESNAKEKQRATEEAVAKCQRCCTDVEAIDALVHKQQYARVVLEVCTCKFGRLPKIANFVHHHAEKHKRLEIEYINARMPHLIFYDDEGEKKEEVSIASWDEETISEFIEAKLKKIEETVEGQEETEGEATPEPKNPEVDEVVEVEVSPDAE